MTLPDRIDTNRIVRDETRPLPRPAPDRRVIPGRHAALEPLDPARHGPDLWRAAAMDTPEGRAVWDYLPDGPFADESAHRAWLDAIAAPADPLVYAITLPDGRAVGTIALMSIVPAQGVIEIGYVTLSPELQRTTAATEAFFLIMGEAMDRLGYRRLEWKCNANNARSIQAAARLGFAYEGVFFQHRMVKGRNRDTAWFSMADAEWERLAPAFSAWLADDNFDGGRPRASLADLTAAIRRSF